MKKLEVPMGTPVVHVDEVLMDILSKRHPEAPTDCKEHRNGGHARPYVKAKVKVYKPTYVKVRRLLADGKLYIHVSAPYVRS